MRSALLLLSALVACAAPARVPPPAPIHPLPSPAQLRWHALEAYAFVHFNMNTFTDAEWGEGAETPAQFRPSALDCAQWAAVCKSAGLKGIILTAKHHDGFCLWPSRFSSHTVAASPWRDGRGDVLRELSDACRDAGLFFGVYISPWDRNSPLYGDSERYNDYFSAQMEELLTGYGEVTELWWDGACGEGPNGKRQVYDWERFRATARRHAPDAVIFSDVGPDVRWVGNERGFVGETNWNMLSIEGFEPGAKAPAVEVLNTGQEDGTHWIPGECDVSIRPGWYYHADQDDKVKSVEELLAIWHGSVGRGANLLLNLPVDRRGLVHENDAARLREWRAALDALYAEDLAPLARASASAVRGGDAAYGAALVLDDEAETYWAVDDEAREATLELSWDEACRFDRVRLEEPLFLGQRVKAFSLAAEVDGTWRELARGTTIGARCILVFPEVATKRLAIRIEAARATPTLSRVQVFRAPPTER
jgi:alpha-L-fucosidase